MPIWDKVKDVFEVALKQVQEGGKIVGEKAQEGVKVTKIAMERLKIKREISKKLAELGGRIYERRKELGTLLEKDEIRSIIEKIESLEEDLSKLSEKE